VELWHSTDGRNGPLVITGKRSNSMDTPETSAKRPASPLLKADSATLVFVAEKDGKLRVNYQGWADVKVILPGERLEIVASGGQAHLYRRGEPLTCPATDPYREWDGQ
jgi:hypothetical protein